MAGGGWCEMWCQNLWIQLRLSSNLFLSHSGFFFILFFSLCWRIHRKQKVKSYNFWGHKNVYYVVIPRNTTAPWNVYPNPHPFPSGRKILAFCQRWVWRKIWLQISWTLSWRNKITVCQRDQGNITWMMRRSAQVVLSEMMVMGIRLGWWNKIRVSGQRDGEIGHPAGRPFVVKWPKQSKCPQILNFSYNQRCVCGLKVNSLNHLWK